MEVPMVKKKKPLADGSGYSKKMDFNVFQLGLDWSLSDFGSVFFRFLDWFLSDFGSVSFGFLDWFLSDLALGFLLLLSASLIISSDWIYQM